MFYPRFALDKNYTNFGRVIAGMDAVDAIARGEPPAKPTKILQASMESDGKAPPVPVAAALPPPPPAPLAPHIDAAPVTAPAPARAPRPAAKPAHKATSSIKAKARPADAE